MAENCKFAYRKRGDASVHCTLMPKDATWCAHQGICWQSQRWEVNKNVQCQIRKNHEKK